VNSVERAAVPGKLQANEDRYPAILPSGGTGDEFRGRFRRPEREKEADA